jgi:hypothetical protein
MAVCSTLATFTLEVVNVAALAQLALIICIVADATTTAAAARESSSRRFPPSDELRFDCDMGLYLLNNRPGCYTGNAITSCWDRDSRHHSPHQPSSTEIIDHPR